jgi:hypothetical protein
MDSARQEMRSAARAIIPAFLAVLWPKCPLCLAAYGGTLGMLGMGTVLDSAPAKLALLVVVAGLRLYGWMSAPRLPSPAAAIMSLAAVGLLSVSLLAYRSAVVAVSGLALLIMSMVLERIRAGIVDPAAPDPIAAPSCHRPHQT